MRCQVIFTTKNSKEYLENYHSITVPRYSIILTTLLHLFFLNIGMVLMYYYFAPAGGLVVSFEIYYLLSFVRLLWKKSCYSQMLLIITVAVSLVADFFLSFLERRLIAELFNAIISGLGGY